MLAMMPTLSGVVNDPNSERTGTYLEGAELKVGFLISLGKPSF
jgi:hypothetical protein